MVAARGKLPRCGPYGERYRDAYGQPRVRLTRYGRVLCREYLARYPSPLALVVTVFPGLAYKARLAGMPDDEIEAAGLCGVAKAFSVYEPSLGTKAETVVAWWVRGELAHAVEKARRFCRERQASEVWAEVKAYQPADRRRVSDPFAGDEVRELMRRGNLGAREREAVWAWARAGNYEAGAALLGVTRERVRQLVLSGMAKLKKAAGVSA